MKIEWARWARHAPRAACLAAAALLLAAGSCRQDLAMNVDSKFSVNLVQPSAYWPRLKELTPAQLEAFNKYGKPDYFRVWFNSKGEIATSREAGPAIRGRQLSQLPCSWVYESRKVELQFVSPAKFAELPLSDQLKVLCLRGDPQERDRQSLADGSVRELWTYFDVGEKYIFVDGRQTDRQVFKAIGKPFTRM